MAIPCKGVQFEILHESILYICVRNQSYILLSIHIQLNFVQTAVDVIDVTIHDSLCGIEYNYYYVPLFKNIRSSPVYMQIMET